MDKTGIPFVESIYLKSTCIFIHVEDQEVCSSKDEVFESFRTLNEKFEVCKM
jgi:hypothetical protein